MSSFDDIPSVGSSGPMGSDTPPKQVILYAAPPPPSGLRGFLTWAGRVIIAVSIIINIMLFFLIAAALEGETLPESHYAGDENSSAKLALVRVDGIIMEGFLGYPERQLRQAAQDDKVMAIILAINSPGGSVTASDQLYKQVDDLRQGQWDGQDQPKPVVVAMESIAASGGYYIAAGADRIFAQPTTVTGSIGVYAPFIDLTRVPDKWGVDMQIIKKGELKGMSMFHEMSPEEKAHWDEMLEASYQRFMQIVKEGRGDKLKFDLRDELPKKGNKQVRRIADGGVFTAQQAKEYGLVDEIGYLNDAIVAARELAGIERYQVVSYDAPVGLTDFLIAGKQAGRGKLSLDFSTRRWYLTPGHEAALLARLPFPR